MSEVITVGTGTETIHGTYAGAIAYVDIMFGETYSTWSALAADDQKKTLAAAVRFLNAQSWAEAYDTFAERDLIAEFATAQYELAVLVANDPSVIQEADQGSNIQSLQAGSAGITFFNSTTSSGARSAPKLPPVLMRLLGGYLAASALSGPDGGESRPSCADNPFFHDYKRSGPY
jgi:hypothetical protein